LQAGRFTRCNGLPVPVDRRRCHAAEQLGLSPILTCAANSSGGVMGKMIDAQSIVVASTATQWYRHEGDILRYIFFHSVALAALMGLLVMAQAYVWPFTALVER
jgi:lactate permease